MKEQKLCEGRRLYGGRKLHGGRKVAEPKASSSSCALSSASLSLRVAAGNRGVRRGRQGREVR
jgi:hypothetical protein